MMILLNAVYFKGIWKNKFKENKTKLEPFHINETTTVNVPMMSNVKEYFYKDLKEIDAECIALPYEVHIFVFILFCFAY
jgi:serine protease inhibitor